MTVTNTSPRADYVGNGSVSAYDFDFPVAATSEIAVYKTDLAGAVIELALTTGFTAVLNTDGSGTITLVAGNLTSGHLLSIVPDATLNQLTDFAARSIVSPANTQTAADRLNRQVQQVNAAATAAIRLSPAEDPADYTMTLPTVDLRAGLTLGFDEDGNIMAGSSPGEATVSAYGATLIDDANAAAARTTLGLDTTVVYTVATIAALKALTTFYTTVEVLGYTTAGDGGGGLFQWNSSDATADNTGTIIIPNSAPGTGRWNRIPGTGSVFNVKTFGAVGDRANDDAPAINATLAWARLQARPGTLNQVGGRVYLPKGRYLIKSTISVVEGDIIEGDPSGLDSDPLATASSGTNIVVSTTLAGGGAWNNSVAITVTGGGPLHISNIGFNGTQTVTDSTWLKSGDGSTDIGITQAHFKGLRVVGFTTGVKAYKFFDVDLNDVGFESNEVDFDIYGTGSFDDFSAVRFANCTFFSPGTAYFQISAGATPKRVSFSACEFYQSASGAGHFGILLYDGAMSDWQFSACTIVMQASNYFFRCIDATATLNGLSFSGCSISGGNIIAVPATPAASSMKSIRFSGCKISDSPISLDTVSRGFVLVGNTITLASTVTITAGNDSVIVGNDFSLCTGSVLVPAGVHAGLLIVGNNFPAAYTSLGINSKSTRVTTGLNTGVPDFASGSATYDPPSLADGAGATTTVTASGAELGDYATASFSLDLQGITVSAYVSAANTVAVRFQNESGGVLDLASGTLRVTTRKP